MAAKEEIVATLFFRPMNRDLISSGEPFISTDVISSFVSTLQSIDSASSPPEHRTQSLDGSSRPHMICITFTSTSPITQFRSNTSIAAFEREHGLEVVFQHASTQRAPTRLAVFDMDSTLIQQEVIDLLASVAGVEPQVSDITARAMNGELDFAESLRERVALLKGLPADVFEQLKPRLTLTPGADTLLRGLKKLGVKTALLSGGFTPLASYIADKLGIDHVHANDLASAPADPRDPASPRVLTGELAPSAVIVDSARKKHLLETIAAEHGITDAAGILAVGDGANDLPMLWAAGLGVAVNAKPRVQAEAPARLNGPTALLDVFYVIGLSTEEIDRLAEG